MWRITKSRSFQQKFTTSIKSQANIASLPPTTRTYLATLDTAATTTNNNSITMRLTAANLSRIGLQQQQQHPLKLKHANSNTTSGNTFDGSDTESDTSSTVTPTPTAPATTASSPLALLSYDRSRMTAGILHVGVGNFYKGHWATYMHNLLQRDAEDNMEAGATETTTAQHQHWGICGAGVHPAHTSMHQALQAQDCLFTVIERSAGSAKPTIVGSMIDCLAYDASDSGPNDNDEVSSAAALQHKPLAAKMLDPSIRIVSMTVTEGGYYLAGEDNQLDVHHPAIQRDARNPDAPRTLFGIILQALRKRRAAGVAPFTVLSCDNIVHNGDVVKSVVLGLAKLQQGAAGNNDNDDFVAWLEANVTFPNSMVDRITPVTTEAEKAHGTMDSYGFHDEAVVYCEPWRQWVLEDNFCAGRPALELLDSVAFVPDVTPYELMKIRILNGGHAALCYPAFLLELPYIHDAMQHATIGRFLDKLERTEIVPQVGHVPNTNTLEYWYKTQERFHNPTILDSIARNCRDGSARQPKFIVPTAIDNLKHLNHENGASSSAGVEPKGLALVSALWCRYCTGTTEKTGQTYGGPQVDVQWDRLHKLAVQARDSNDPKQWLEGLPDVYADLATNDVFVKLFSDALRKIYADGVEAALQAYVDEE